MDDKIRKQSKATEKYQETIFEELKELEEGKSKEAVMLALKNHIFDKVSKWKGKSGTAVEAGRIESDRTKV